MPNKTLSNVDVALFYIEDIPAEYLDDFRKLAGDGLNILEKSRENEPYAAIEWVIPTAIAVYIGKPFIDAFIKRAADDVADAIYPKFKAALVALVKKIFIRERGAFGVISSASNKVISSQSLIFSVYSETRIKNRIKFVFNQELSEIEYEECVEQIFATLREHHNADGDEDRVSRDIAEVCGIRSREVYMIYDAKKSRWEIIDPIVKIME